MTSQAVESPGAPYLKESPLVSSSVHGPNVKENEERVDKSVACDSVLDKLVGSSSPFFHTLTLHSRLGDNRYLNSSTSGLSSCALATAQVVISSPIKQYTRVTRAFFDTGSQLSLVTADIVDELDLSLLGNTRLVLSGINASAPSKQYKVVRILVKLGDSSISMSCVVIDKIPISITTPGLGKIKGSEHSTG